MTLINRDLWPFVGKDSLCSSIHSADSGLMARDSDVFLADAFMVALTRCSGIILGVFLSVVLAVLVFPKSASHQATDNLSEALLSICKLCRLAWMQSAPSDQSHSSSSSFSPEGRYEPLEDITIPQNEEKLSPEEREVECEKVCQDLSSAKGSLGHHSCCKQLYICFCIDCVLAPISDCHKSCIRSILAILLLRPKSLFRIRRVLFLLKWNECCRCLWTFTTSWARQMSSFHSQDANSICSLSEVTILSCWSSPTVLTCAKCSSVYDQFQEVFNASSQNQVPCWLLKLLRHISFSQIAVNAVCKSFCVCACGTD